MEYDKNNINCSHADIDNDKTPSDSAKFMVSTDTIKGLSLSRKVTDTIFQNYVVKKLFITSVVHVIGRSSPTGGFEAIIDETRIKELFRVANEIWSQACIE